jgi:hypothetical protein
LVMVTLAFGTTAPVGSVIVPVMPALACPNAAPGANEIKNAIASMAEAHRPAFERRNSTAHSLETGFCFTLPPGITQFSF